MAVNIRRAVLDDAAEIARVQVESWRATYRGILPDKILDDNEFYRQQKQFWHQILENHSLENNIAIAEQNNQVIGVAFSGPPRDADATWNRELYLMYIDNDFHARGIGSQLLAEVLPATKSTSLWVFENNSRAIAFYRKHGFRLEAARKPYLGTSEIRMTRPEQPVTT